MNRVTVEFVAACAAIVSALLVTRMSVSPDENVEFFIALIIGLTVWEASRFLLQRMMRG